MAWMLTWIWTTVRGVVRLRVAVVGGMFVGRVRLWEQRGIVCSVLRVGIEKVTTERDSGRLCASVAPNF